MTMSKQSHFVDSALAVRGSDETGRPGAPATGLVRFQRLDIGPALALGVLLEALVYGAVPGAATPLQDVRRAEQERIEVVRRIAPATVCIFDAQQRGGGSGVLIDPDGYGVTNYHVVAGMLETRKGWGGLGDGVLYELRVLGVDVTGDVAMFRLISPKEPFAFPHVPLGDSDHIKLGDPVLVLGNPFSLSEDYSPTVTMGLVTGMHRYQKGFQGNLVYSDCLQTDASVNPGNSGGPLFNLAGEVIGINGRISVNTRGRFNVGFGYAISVNQIRRFLPALRAGLLARHGSWEATVAPREGGDVVFDQMRRDGAAYRAGLRIGDILLALDDTAIASVNQAVSLLGTFPQRWPVLVRFRREGVEYETVVRLDPVQPHLRVPFEPDRDAALAQVRSLIDGFRASLPHDSRTASTTRYAAERTRRDAESTVRESHALTLQDGGPAKMTRILDDGSTGRIIEFDAAAARQRAATEAEAFDVSPLEAVALSSLYVVLAELGKPPEALDLSAVSHKGGDAYSPVSSSRGPWKVGERPFSGEWNPRLLEVIEWPLGEQGVAELKFDPDTHELVGITARDRLSGAEADIAIGLESSPGGPVRITVDVKGPGLGYRDILTSIEEPP